MPFILDDSRVNRAVFPQFEQPKDRIPIESTSKPRKLVRSRTSPTNRAERYLRALKLGLAGDTVVYAKVAQIEKEARRRAEYTPKAKPRRTQKSTAGAYIAVSTTDI